MELWPRHAIAEGREADRTGRDLSNLVLRSSQWTGQVSVRRTPTYSMTPSFRTIIDRYLCFTSQYSCLVAPAGLSEAFVADTLCFLTYLQNTQIDTQLCATGRLRGGDRHRDPIAR